MAFVMSEAEKAERARTNAIRYDISSKFYQPRAAEDHYAVLPRRVATPPRPRTHHAANCAYGKLVASNGVSSGGAVRMAQSSSAAARSSSQYAAVQSLSQQQQSSSSSSKVLSSSMHQGYTSAGNIHSHLAVARDRGVSYGEVRTARNHATDSGHWASIKRSGNSFTAGNTTVMRPAHYTTVVDERQVPTAASRRPPSRASTGSDDYFLVRVERGTKLAGTMAHAYQQQQRDVHGDQLVGRVASSTYHNGVTTTSSSSNHGRVVSRASSAPRARRTASEYEWQPVVRERVIAPATRTVVQRSATPPARTVAWDTGTSEWYGEGHRPYRVDPVSDREYEAVHRHHSASRRAAQHGATAESRMEEARASRQSTLAEKQARAREYMHQASQRHASSVGRRSGRGSSGMSMSARMSSPDDYHKEYLHRTYSHAPPRSARLAQKRAQSRVNYSSWSGHNDISRRVSNRKLNAERERFSTWRYQDAPLNTRPHKCPAEGPPYCADKSSHVRGSRDVVVAKQRGLQQFAEHASFAQDYDERHGARSSNSGKLVTTTYYDAAGGGGGGGGGGGTVVYDSGANYVTTTKTVVKQSSSEGMSAREQHEAWAQEKLIPAVRSRNINPAPGRYNSKSSFGRQGMSSKPSNPAFTMRAKLDPSSRYPTPGPADYQSRTTPVPAQRHEASGVSGFGHQPLSYKPDNPAYSIGRAGSGANLLAGRPHTARSMGSTGRLRHPTGPGSVASASHRPTGPFIRDYNLVVDAVLRPDEDAEPVPRHGEARLVEHTVAKAVFVIEACRGCDRHRHVADHDEGRYRALAKRLKQALLAVWPSASVHINPKASGTDTSNGGGSGRSLELPRLGAMEVSLNGQLLASKLLSGQWPTIDDVLVYATCAMEGFLASQGLPRFLDSDSDAEDASVSDDADADGSGPWVTCPTDDTSASGSRIAVGSAVMALIPGEAGEQGRWMDGQVAGIHAEPPADVDVGDAAAGAEFVYAVMVQLGPQSVTSPLVWLPPSSVKRAPPDMFRVGQRVEYSSPDGLPKRIAAIREDGTVDIEVGRWCWPQRHQDSGRGVWPGGLVVHRRTRKHVPVRDLDPSFALPPYVPEQPFRVGSYVSRHLPGERSHGLCGRVAVVRAGACDVEYEFHQSDGAGQGEGGAGGTRVVVKHVPIEQLSAYNATHLGNTHDKRLAADVMRMLPGTMGRGETEEEARANAGKPRPGAIVLVKFMADLTPARVLDVDPGRQLFSTRVGGRVVIMPYRDAHPFTTRVAAGAVADFRDDRAGMLRRVRIAEVQEPTLRVVVDEVPHPSPHSPPRASATARSTRRPQSAGPVRPPRDAHVGSLQGATVMILNKSTHEWQAGVAEDDKADDAGHRVVDVRLDNGWLVSDVPLKDVRVTMPPPPQQRGQPRRSISAAHRDRSTGAGGGGGVEAGDSTWSDWVEEAELRSHASTVLSEPSHAQPPYP